MTITAREVDYKQNKKVKLKPFMSLGICVIA